jgi:hypothetical protein
MNVSISETSKRTSPNPFTIAQALFGVNALIWLVIYLVSLSITRKTGGELLVTLLVGGNIIAMLLAGLALSSSKKIATYFAASVLLFNVLIALPLRLHPLFNPLTVLIDLLLLGMLPLLETRERTTVQ